MYAAAVAAVLSRYPPFVTDYVADPRVGIASRSKFLPSVAEICEACEIRAGEHQQSIERERRIRKQFAEREADGPPTERLKAMGRAWLDRTDTQARQLSGETSNGKAAKKIYTEAEKAAFIESAKKAGQEISGLTLRPETIATLAPKPE